jgi:hypothetical protein
MSKELAPNPQLIDEHLQLLVARLNGVPELEPAFAIIEHDPQHARDVYTDYVQLVERMSQLDETDIAKMREAQLTLRSKDGIAGSASKIGASDILSVLGDRASLLYELVDQSNNPTSLFYDPAINVLVTRMEGGHNLKLSGKSPSDFDSESLKVIWGHTVIIGPEALLHFTICHYLERFMAEGLSANGIEIARQKDFFINALVDVVILENFSVHGNSPIFELWVKSKNQGGLGWITRDRLDSHSSGE